jgi:hypothetical protein
MLQKYLIQFAMLIIISPVLHIQLSLPCRCITKPTILHMNAKLSTSGASLETKLGTQKFQVDQLLQFTYTWQWNQNNLPWLCTGPAFQSQAWWAKRMFFLSHVNEFSKTNNKICQYTKEWKYYIFTKNSLLCGMWDIVWKIWQFIMFDINLLKMERILLYIRKQSVPCCKHFPPRL